MQFFIWFCDKLTRLKSILLSEKKTKKRTCRLIYNKRQVFRLYLQNYLNCFYFNLKTQPLT